MSDRTTLYLNYAACDRKAVERKLGEPNYEEPENGIIFAQFDEVNYGGQNELAAIVKRGVPFWGKHDAGYEYTSSLLAGVGRRSYEFCASRDAETLCVEINVETGRLLGLSEASKFRKRWLRAKAAVIKRAETSKESGENKS